MKNPAYVNGLVRLKRKMAGRLEKVVAYKASSIRIDF